MALNVGSLRYLFPESEVGRTPRTSRKRRSWPPNKARERYTQFCSSA